MESDDLPITFEGDEPLTTPNEACRTVLNIARVAGIVGALIVICAAPRIASFFN